MSLVERNDDSRPTLFPSSWPFNLQNNFCLHLYLFRICLSPVHLRLSSANHSMAVPAKHTNGSQQAVPRLGGTGRMDSGVQPYSVKFFRIWCTIGNVSSFVRNVRISSRVDVILVPSPIQRKCQAGSPSSIIIFFFPLFAHYPYCLRTLRLPPSLSAGMFSLVLSSVLPSWRFT